MTGLCALLAQLRLAEVDQLDYVGRVDSSDRAIAIARRKNLPARINDELRGLNDAATILPPGTQLVGDLARYPISHWKRHFRRDLGRLVNGIHAGGEYAGTNRVQFGLELLEADQLSATIRSPVTSIEQNHPVLRAYSARQVDRSAVDEADAQVRQRVTDTQLF